MSLDGEVSPDVMAALADDLDGLDGPQVLVIDDFHLTGAAGVETLNLLLECWPAAVQLVLASRADPGLRLHRMRANDELVEVRDRDLSFSAEETGLFLSGFGLSLSERDLNFIHQRSEGWAAGLQMAAISIQHSPDPLSTAGRVELHRHTVAGYFLDEVLYRQSPELVEFMLATSILDELSVPACKALCGPGSAVLLEQLYSANLFVTCVDDEAVTYRYHQLIKEVLQAQLHRNDPVGERRLHDQAAQYLADSGQVGPAARHLLAAGDHAGAFRLIRERLILDFETNPRIGSSLDLDEIRPELFAGSPELLVALAADLQLRGGSSAAGGPWRWPGRPTSIQPSSRSSPTNSSRPTSCTWSSPASYKRHWTSCSGREAPGSTVVPSTTGTAPWTSRGPIATPISVNWSQPAR